MAAKFNYFSGILERYKLSRELEGAPISREEAEQALIDRVTLTHERNWGHGREPSAIKANEAKELFLQAEKEFVHYCLSHRVIRLAAPMAYGLMNTEFHMQLRGLLLPYPVFEIAVEKGVRPFESGPEVSGIIVQVSPDNALTEAVRHFYKKIKAQTGIEIFNERDVLRFMNMSRLSFDYRFKETAGHGYYDVEKEYEDMTIDEVIDSDMAHFIKERGGLSTAQQLYFDFHKKMARLAIGTICIYNTADPDILPHVDEEKGQPIVSVPEAGEIMGSRMQRLTAGEYYSMRKGHMRTLLSERYKRDPSGRVRVIWIQPTSVHYGKKTQEKKPEITTFENPPRRRRKASRPIKWNPFGL